MPYSWPKFEPVPHGRKAKAAKAQASTPDTKSYAEKIVTLLKSLDAEKFGSGEAGKGRVKLRCRHRKRKGYPTCRHVVLHHMQPKVDAKPKAALPPWDDSVVIKPSGHVNRNSEVARRQFAVPACGWQGVKSVVKRGGGDQSKAQSICDSTSNKLPVPTEGVASSNLSNNRKSGSKSDIYYRAVEKHPFLCDGIKGIKNGFVLKPSFRKKKTVAFETELSSDDCDILSSGYAKFKDNGKPCRCEFCKRPAHICCNGHGPLSFTSMSGHSDKNQQQEAKHSPRSGLKKKNPYYWDMYYYRPDRVARSKSEMGRMPPRRPLFDDIFSVISPPRVSNSYDKPSFAGSIQYNLYPKKNNFNKSVRWLQPNPANDSYSNSTVAKKGIVKSRSLVNMRPFDNVSCGDTTEKLYEPPNEIEYSTSNPSPVRLTEEQLIEKYGLTSSQSECSNFSCGHQTSANTTQYLEPNAISSDNPRGTSKSFSALHGFPKHTFHRSFSLGTCSMFSDPWTNVSDNRTAYRSSILNDVRSRLDSASRFLPSRPSVLRGRWAQPRASVINMSRLNAHPTRGSHSAELRLLDKYLNLGEISTAKCDVTPQPAYLSKKIEPVPDTGGTQSNKNRSSSVCEIPPWRNLECSLSHSKEREIKQNQKDVVPGMRDKPPWRNAELSLTRSAKPTGKQSQSDRASSAQETTAWRTSGFSLDPSKDLSINRPAIKCALISSRRFEGAESESTWTIPESSSKSTADILMGELGSLSRAVGEARAAGETLKAQKGGSSKDGLFKSAGGAGCFSIPRLNKDFLNYSKPASNRIEVKESTAKISVPNKTPEPEVKSASNRMESCLQEEEARLRRVDSIIG